MQLFVHIPDWFSFEYLEEWSLSGQPVPELNYLHS